MKIIVLGATGMLGYSIWANLVEKQDLQVLGTVRDIGNRAIYFKEYKDSIVHAIDVNDRVALNRLLNQFKPDIVINCVGVIKQHKETPGYIENAIELNSLLPHKLASICDEYGAKLIHFSTDCVFSGDKGNYSEIDVPDAVDLYGRSKNLGEVDYNDHLTLRTSIIGHELGTAVSLVDWFLGQNSAINGYSRAIFSGLPTVYIAEILYKYIISNMSLKGLYHLSALPIDKYHLLRLVAEMYGVDVEINRFDEFAIDRSLNSEKLTVECDLDIPSWPELIKFMYSDYVKRYKSCLS